MLYGEPYPTINTTMDYELLATLRRHHPAWRLLAADNAPFVIGFLYEDPWRTLWRRP